MGTYARTDVTFSTCSLREKHIIFQTSNNHSALSSLKTASDSGKI
jgi:hypothetical protein